MKSKRAIIIGDVRDGEFEELLTSGVDVDVVLVRNKSTKLTKSSLVTFHDYIGKESDEVVRYISKLISECDQFGILNFRESLVGLTSLICKSLGLKAHSAAPFFLDKVKLRKRLTLEPQHRLFSYENDFLEFPYVIKPNNLSSSLFVFLARRFEDLSMFKQTVFPKYLTYIQAHEITDSTLVIEPFFDGTVHSIDGMIDSFGNIATTPVIDVSTGYDLERGDFHHYSRKAPSELTLLSQHTADTYIRKCFEFLPTDPMAFHAEFIYTKNGPRLLEIGPRPGGNRFRILNRVFNLCPENLYFEAMRGGRVPNNRIEGHSNGRHFCMITPFAKLRQAYKGSLFAKMRPLLRSEVHQYDFLEVGDMIGPVYDGFLNYYTIELMADNWARIEHDLKVINSYRNFFYCGTWLVFLFSYIQM